MPAPGIRARPDVRDPGSRRPRPDGNLDPRWPRNPHPDGPVRPPAASCGSRVRGGAPRRRTHGGPGAAEPRGGGVAVAAAAAAFAAAASADAVVLANGPESLRDPRTFVTTMARAREALGPVAPLGGFGGAAPAD